MTKAVKKKAVVGVNRQHLYWKIVGNKRYQLKVKERKGKTEKLYELQITANNLDRFSDEEKTVFLNMEDELNNMDFDFEGLEKELNSIDFSC